MRLIRVLILEPDPLELDVLLKRLKKKGVSVKGAKSAKPGSEEISGFRPDVIIVEPWDRNQKLIVDIQNLIRQARDSRIIVLTRQAGLEHAEQALKQGAADFLLKPCPVEDILAVIHRAAADNR